MSLNEMIIPNKDFQTSINIEFDFGSKAKIKSLIPTDSVCRHLEEIIKDVIVSSNQRAKLLVGAYGKGKSHVVLAALTAMWLKEPECYSRIVKAFRDRNLGFGDTFERYVSEGKRLLPVVITGSTSDLRHSLLHALRNALKLAGLVELMPQTNYDGAISVLERWQDEYPETLDKFEELTGCNPTAIIARLRGMDTSAYELFVEAYPALTSGGKFDVLDGAEVLQVYDYVLGKLSDAGIDGIYVVYDEFSKYLETSIDRATFEDTKLLQDFAEACNRSGNTRQLHLLLISHKSVSNYIDSNLPKEKVDGWRGVSGRFREIEMIDDANQYYELLASAICKDCNMWKSWLSQDHGANDNMLKTIGARYYHEGVFDSDVVDLVTRGCYPLHPITAFLLARMSEKVAQNERTLFTFICSSEENSLSDALKHCETFISPDYVYSYFEPLLRKEYYTSPLHRSYELARATLKRVDGGSLEAVIIKTIAAIDIVAQYDKVAPTKQTIRNVLIDCGYAAEEVERSLDDLVASDSIVYLRRRNGYLKLKETSGVRVDSEISDRAEKIRLYQSPVDILNRAMRGRALYPSRYNDDKGMVRYFDCGFVDAVDLADLDEDSRILDGQGDGQVVAVYADTQDALNDAKRYAKESLSVTPMTVAVFPRHYIDVTDALYKFEASKQLKTEAGADEVLAEEYEIVIEDCSEIIDDYIAGFLQPELGRSLYFIGGVRKKAVTRKRKLSEELSTLCYSTYGNTPRITSESLNKSELTGIAFSSRTKILKALCSKNLEPNFGFLGNGQELTMARSAFERTGIISDLATSATTPGASLEPGMDYVLSTIRSFVENAHQTPFSRLYDQLTGPELGIGLRRGPIPLYLAYVLREYRNEIKITRDGEERTLSETVLDDLSEQPHEYRLTRLNWSPEMADYLRGLALLFGCELQEAGRNEVAEAIRLWYVELPQLTRNSRQDHSASGKGSDAFEKRAQLFKAIKRIETDSNVFLFDELPKGLGLSADSPELLGAIALFKEDCDGYLDRTTDAIRDELKRLFDPDSHKDATLGSVLRDWLESNPITDTHVFTGISNQVLNAIKDANGDDRATVRKIAKSATSLRIEDWNDARFDDFYDVVTSVKAEIEGARELDDGPVEKNQIGILFVDAEGEFKQRTFYTVECSGRSRLLKNNIKACLSEMGGALRPEEKRQVVFEILEELC